MKSFYKHLGAVLIALLAVTNLSAQVGIGTTSPDASSILDVTSTCKGALVPRMTTAQRTAIVSPAQGLIVYDVDYNGFFYFDGTKWVDATAFANFITYTPPTTVVISNLLNIGLGVTPTNSKLAVNGGIEADSLILQDTVLINNTDPTSLYYGGHNGWYHTTSYANLFLGKMAGYRTSSGHLNTFVGMGAGQLNTTGSHGYFAGYNAGYNNISGEGNMFVGYLAGYNNTSGSSNQYLGYEAGYSNTSGIDNQYIGYQCGYKNTTGAGNMFIGQYAGYSNTIGSGNMFVGSRAGYKNLIGYGDHFVGIDAGYNNLTGVDNFAEGQKAGYSNTISNHNYFSGNGAGMFTSPLYDKGYNTFAGNIAGYSNVIGTYNTCFGYAAGMYNIAGDYNTAVGYQTRVGDSISLITTIDSSVLIGNDAQVLGNGSIVIGSTASTGSGVKNGVAIGQHAKVNSSNTMVLGDSRMTQWGFGTNPGAGYALQVGTNSTNGNGAYLTTGGVWTNTSDRNKKENFTTENSADVLNRINQLNITRWNYKGEDKNITHIGPIAQDFYKQFHTGSDSITISTIDPSGVALIGIQELSKQNQELKARIDKLEKQNAELSKQSITDEKNQASLSNDIKDLKIEIELLKQASWPVQQTAKSDQNK